MTWPVAHLEILDIAGSLEEMQWFSMLPACSNKDANTQIFDSVDMG